MEEDVKTKLEEIGKRLNLEYLKAGTKSKKRRIFFDLYSFNVLMENEFGYGNKHLWEFDDDISSEDLFLDNVSYEKKKFFEISKTVVNNFIEVDYPFYQSYNKSLPRLSKKEIVQIVLSFLESFDKEIALKFKNKANNFQIIETNLIEDGGYINPFEIINDSIIVVGNGEGYNLDFARSLVHECGHLFELESLYSQNRYNYRSNSMLTPYYEVASSFFEYAFLRYLKDNRIINHSIDLALHNYYLDLFINNFYMNVISMKKELTLDGDLIFINESNISSYADNVMNKANYYDIMHYNEGLDYRFSYIYPIGQLLAIYMYDKYIEDKDKFIMNFKKCLLMYPSLSRLETFKDVGAEYDKLKEGKVLKKVLKGEN